MDKYIVKPVHIFSNLIEVEANSEDDARHNALNKIQNDDERYKNYYESTLPIENWAVILKEDYEKIKAQVQEKLNADADANTDSSSDSNIIVP